MCILNDRIVIAVYGVSMHIQGRIGEYELGNEGAAYHRAKRKRQPVNCGNMAFLKV